MRPGLRSLTIGNDIIIDRVNESDDVLILHIPHGWCDLPRIVGGSLAWPFAVRATPDDNLVRDCALRPVPASSPQQTQASARKPASPPQNIN